jgi:hypothetical protein
MHAFLEKLVIEVGRPSEGGEKSAFRRSPPGRASNGCDGDTLVRGENSAASDRPGPNLKRRVAVMDRLHSSDQDAQRQGGVVGKPYAQSQ